MKFDLTSVINKLDPAPEKSGGTLIALNILSMILAGLSNTFAAASDKNTSSEDKKFLIPAGLATSVANILAYCAVTLNIKKVLENDADKAYAQMEKQGTLLKNASEYVEKSIKKAEGGLFNTGILKKKPEYIASMKETLKNADGTLTQEAKNLYKSSLKGGAGVMGAFAGAVIGCGILTPIIRDVSAYFVQKQMEKKNPELKNVPYKPYFDPAHLKVTHSAMYKNTPKQPLNMNTYMTFTKGSMKI